MHALVTGAGGAIGVRFGIMLAYRFSRMLTGGMNTIVPSASAGGSWRTASDACGWLRLYTSSARA